MSNYLERFTFIGNGIWRQETYGMAIMLNEDYKRTFCAYHWNRPLWRFVAKNKNGNPIRFRSAEAAARHLFKNPVTVMATDADLDRAFHDLTGTEPIENKETKT